MLVYDEITRMFLIQYLNLNNEFDADTNNDDDGIKAIGVAQGFLTFIKNKAENSTDLSVVYICRYWLLMNVFKLYSDSQKMETLS